MAHNIQILGVLNWNGNVCMMGISMNFIITQDLFWMVQPLMVMIMMIITHIFLIYTVMFFNVLN